MMRLTHNTLSENVCAQTSELLNRRLAPAIDPHGQLKQARRNVGGPTFIAVPELFDRVTREAESDSDLIAERTVGRDAVAEKTVQVASERTFAVPYPLRIADESQRLFPVAAVLAAFGQSAREAIGQSAAIGDADTADFFIEISRGVDDRLWFVESHAAPI
jgi:starvation-inducible DNA-binding protein